MRDYSITWEYICVRMKEKFGIPTDDTEKFSFGEIKRYLECIWDEYVDILNKIYTNKEIKNE